MLYVHVGLPRTGTTSIQSWLTREADGKNLLLLGTPIRGGRLPVTMRPFWRQAVFAASAQDVVISHETLIGSWTNAWEYQRSNLRELAHGLLGRDARVIVTLRDPLSWFVSLYRHECGRGFSGSLSEFVSTVGGVAWSSPLRLTDDVVRAFGPQAVIVYSIEGTSAVARFAEAINRAQGFVDVPRKRVSDLEVSTGGFRRNTRFDGIQELVGNDSHIHEMLQERLSLVAYRTRWATIGATLEGFPSPQDLEVSGESARTRETQVSRVSGKPLGALDGGRVRESVVMKGAYSGFLARPRLAMQALTPTLFVYLSRRLQKRRASRGTLREI